MCRAKDPTTGEPGRRCPSSCLDTEERRAANRHRALEGYRARQAMIRAVMAEVDAVPPDARIAWIEAELAGPEVAAAGRGARGAARGKAGRRIGLERALRRELRRRGR